MSPTEIKLLEWEDEYRETKLDASPLRRLLNRSTSVTLEKVELVSSLVSSGTSSTTNTILLVTSIRTTV